ncbi:MAG: DNA (cytosine-5-)-methyltransferase [Syntrophales bacterium]|nr:DNA (cytosine-5-)-methyltransferase [Syntrophales bacterium]
MGGKLTAVSLFSGCGGFDWGVHQAGVEIIFANDIDPHAAAAYKALFPKVDFILGDICNIHEFPKADILIGCYPCTGFSVASRRRWHNSEKRDLRKRGDNFLYEQFLRALSQIRPKYLFVENVKGMLSAEKGWFLRQQIQGFKRLGYEVKHKLMSAEEFGVPQSRQRVFIVGIRKDIINFEYCFPAPTHGPKGLRDYVVLQDAVGNMEEWPVGEFFDYKFHGHYLTRNRKRGWHELSYTIVADCRHMPLHPIGKPMKYIKKDTWALQGKFNRRLSWRECARIQQLPKIAIPSGTLDDKYRVIGNAVPPAFGTALLMPIVKFEFFG